MEAQPDSAAPRRPHRGRWLLWGINLAITLALGGWLLWEMALPQAVVATTVVVVPPLIEPIFEAVVPTQVAGIAIPRPSFVSEPLAKPAGHILFARAGAIWVWIDGDTRPLAPGGGNEYPRWSPDGTGIVYVHRGLDFSDIWLMDASGREARQLTRNGNRFGSNSTWAFAPEWAPDGRSIAYLTDISTYDLALWQMDPDGRNPRRLTFLTDYTGGVQAAVWSPAGDQLAISAFASNKIQQIYLYEPRTRRLTPVTSSAEGAYDPVFSPDGHRLAYVVRDHGKHDVWIYELEGGISLPVTTDGYSRAPAWSPAGNELAYLSGKDGSWDIWLVGIVAGDGQTVVGRPHPVTRGLNAEPGSGLSWWRPQ